ncbi:ATP phosphoribosyltransferase [Agrococcus sp. ARC_14]|uniref:ATP phosphoribosyltransferase n=1 Tax=Agrococcus sp. ARC_14 TaxID=2919927 RepID=UPI001F068DC4|nr:ATP phosphoribosyltransferase [Agrococcus sp. ARC_14]MCH1883102.1 ATP phosphoribosyltransferase [Agrococcus sp. ARC_14]
MLKIAVPNKGSLAETAAWMLDEAGYRGRRDGKELIVVDARNEVEFFFLRPRDIATYVGSGALDVGITGRDLLLDSGSDAVEVEGLGFARSTFRFAGPAGTFHSAVDLQGVRIASSYALLVERHLAEHGVTAELVRLDGAVESAVRLGVADAVADVVETGGTLKAQGLEVFGDPILSSEAVLISNGGSHPGLATLKRRLDGVMVARDYVLVDYDIERSRLDAAVSIAEGFESATVSPLQKEGWVAVRVMVRRDETNQIMDALADAGARAIIVSRIHAARIS